MLIRTQADLQAVLNVGGTLEPDAKYYCNPYLNGSVAFQSNTKIFGRGRGSSIIYLANGGNPSGSLAFLSHGVSAPLPLCGYYKENVTISGVTIDGNRANNGGLVDGLFGAGIKSFSAPDVETMNCSEVGAVLGATYADDDSDQAENTATSIFSHHNGEGIQTAGATGARLFALHNDGAGVRVVALYAGFPLKQPYMELVGVVSMYNAVAYLIENQLGNPEFPVTLTGCVGSRCTNGAILGLRQAAINGGSYTNNSESNVIIQADNTRVQNATIKNAGINGVLWWGDRFGCTVTGNLITDDQASKTQQYAFGENGASGAGSGNLIALNQVGGNKLAVFSPGMIEDRGGMYIVRDNPGYNPVGEFLATAIGSAPYFYYIAGASPETLYITSGDVFNVVKRNISLGSATRMVNLEPGERVDIASNNVPSIVRSVH